MIVHTRTRHDAYVAVYNIDTAGRISLLFPQRGDDGFVPGRTTLTLPGPSSCSAMCPRAKARPQAPFLAVNCFDSVSVDVSTFGRQGAGHL